MDKKEKEHRYYLFAGMGRSNRLWHRKIRRWTLFAAVVISGLVGVLLWLLNRH